MIVGIPARIKQDSHPKLISWSTLSKLFRTVGGLLHVNVSLSGVFGGSKVAFSNAQRRSVALKSSDAERRRIGLRYLRQPPVIR